MTRPWDGIISEEEQKAYKAAGFGAPQGMGEHPALLIIDVQYRTVGTVGRNITYPEQITKANDCPACPEHHAHARYQLSE